MPRKKPNPNSQAKRTNRYQSDYLISFMAAHPAFATNNNKYLKRSYFEHDRYVESRSFHNKKWEDLTAELNELGPPSRTITAWKQVWLDYKLKVKNKLIFNKKTMEQNPTNYHPFKFILTPDELIVKKVIEGDTTDGVSPIEETHTLDDSQIIETNVIIDSPSSSSSNTADESPVVVKSENPDFTVTTDATILKPKLVGTTLPSSEFSAAKLATSPPTTSHSQSANNIKSLEEENEEIEKHLDELNRKRRKISDTIVDLKRRDFELKGKLHELKEQTLELKYQKVKYKAQKLELKQKELRMKEAAKLQKSINNQFKHML